jgi:hypothetical protein
MQLPNAQALNTTNLVGTRLERPSARFKNSEGGEIT